MRRLDFIPNSMGEPMHHEQTVLQQAKITEEGRRKEAGAQCGGCAMVQVRAEMASGMEKDSACRNNLGASED